MSLLGEDCDFVPFFSARNRTGEFKEVGPGTVIMVS